MDKQANRGPLDESGSRSELATMLSRGLPQVAEWCAQAGTERWEISTARFTSELARCAAARFRDGKPSTEELQTYLSALHMEDLALACACADGVAEAWEYFVGTYRGYLRACAGGMLKSSANSPEAEELADSLFAELYGLKDGVNGEKRGSLLRYFHGRSSLKTWLRAVLAQRHVDKIRAGRRFEGLGEEDGSDGVERRVAGVSASVLQTAADPHRERYLLLFGGALQTALNNLDARDAQRLRMYYSEGKKLAEIGVSLGEHESSVSRHLEKVRREVREAVEGILRAGAAPVNGVAGAKGLSDAEIVLCFEYAGEDAPIDLEKLFSREEERGTEFGGKEI
jgi:RNA polymerase sigma factor (sigma-70 family)